MTARRQRLDIRAALRGERIFITGGTGFLGKVLVEKLLRSVPDVGKLLLLVRPNGERGGAERLRGEILDSPAMARLRALHAGDWEGWAASRLEIVEGDLAQERFGLSEEGYTALADRVDRVVASAATVTFDERLDRALALNARGALRTLELARDAGSVPLLHVSTCFVSGRRAGPVAELPPAWPESDPEETLAALEDACRRVSARRGGGRSLVAAGAQLAARHGFHDVYTLTKALGERLVAARRRAVPVAIVRPAIVESAVAEPIPGWIDAVRVADPLLVAYGRGVDRRFPGTAEARLDIVPVDLVVNAMIAALAELPGGGHEEPSSRGLRVFQVSSSRHPITLGELVAHARRGFERAPLRDENGEPIAVPAPRFVTADRAAGRLRAGRRRLARLGRWLRSTRWAPRLARAERRLGHLERLLDVYRPYLDHGARYEDAATRRLWERLAPEEREEFPFDVATLDWRAYVTEIHVPGLVRFALRAESGAPSPRGDDPVARAHARGEYPAARAATLFELLERAAAADPDAVALQICREGSWLRYSYGQAVTASAGIAARLANDHGIGAGDRVVLWGAACPEWVLTSFAVHRLGAVTVPLDPQWPAEEIEAAARFTEARLICATPALRPALAASEIPVVELSAPWVPEPDAGALPDGAPGAAAGGPDELASILFTSGTTVAPRAVPLTHGNFLANVRDLVPVMRSSRERLLSVLPIHHVFEFTVGLLVPLAGGGTISYLAELKPAEIRWMMQATRPTMMVAVPRLLQLLHDGIEQSVAAGGAPLRAIFRCLGALGAMTRHRFGHRLFGSVHRRFGGCLRRIATGGSALDPELGRSFRTMGFQVAEGYGMTETSPVLTVNPWDDIRFGTVGRPLAGVDVEVRPEEGLAAGCGRVWVRGPNVMGGYYRNPEATREVLRDGWLDTGDVGSFDDAGHLRIVGRTKNVIVTAAGKTVHPEEVEQRYRDLPGVEELVVLGLPAPGGGGESVGAVAVVPADAGDEEVAAVRARIAARAERVPTYQRIARLEIWRGELPKTTTLKVRRGALRDALLAGERGGTGVSRPPAAAESPAVERGDDERWLLDTLARWTRVPPESLGDADRLVELGVDSLMRVELVAAIEGRCGRRIDDDTAAALDRLGDVLALLAPGGPPASGEPRGRESAPRALAGSS